MRRPLILITALLCTTVMTQAQSSSTVTLHLIETSDVHGAFFPYDFIERHPMAGTMARVSTYINRLRQEAGRENVVLLDNGDILQGQPTCYYCNYVKTDLSNVAAEVINYLSYDVEAFGNHDIETGHAVYDKWVSEVRCPMLGANIISTSTDRPYTLPYTIVERQGIRIAVLGMLTPAIPNWLHQSLWSGMRFEEMVSSARKWVGYIKEHEHPDLLVGLFHSGWDGGIATPHYDEDATRKVAEQVEGFDVIFFGHDHTEHNSTTPLGTLCLNPSCNAVKVAHATLQCTRSGGRWTVTGKQGEIVNMTGEAIDEAYMRHFQSQIDSIQSFVSRKIGTFTTAISTRDCFFGPAPFTDYIHNLQLKLTGADVSFNAPLTFDSRIDVGDVYISDMFKLYRFENQIYALNMTGAEIRGHLEMSYDLWVNTMQSPADHAMLLVEHRADESHTRFKNLTFNFDSAAGIDYEVDLTKPDGQKVQILRFSDGRPFDENAWYRVAMNSYRGNGGGGLLTLGAGIPFDSIPGRIVYMSERDQRHYLTQEIEQAGTVSPKANNNWRFVPEAWVRPAIERDRKIIFGD